MRKSISSRGTASARPYGGNMTGEFENDVEATMAEAGALWVRK